MIGPLRSLGQSRLRRAALLLIGAQTFYRLTGLVLLVVLSRFLPANEVGVYFFALSLAESLLLVASLNLEPVLMRRVAAEPEARQRHLGGVLGFRLASGPFYLVIVTIAAAAFAGTIWPVIAFVALFVLLESLYFVFGSLFVALEKVRYNVSIGVPVQALFLAVFLLGMLWSPSLEVVLGANLLRSVCLIVAAAIVTHRLVCPLRVAWDRSLFREGAPFFLLMLVATLGSRVDTLMLGFLTTYETVGHYNLALRIVVAAQFVPAAVATVLFPRLAAEGLTAANHRRLWRGGGLLLGAAVLMAGAVNVGAAPLTTVLYGPLAVAVAPILEPLSLLLPLGFLRLFLMSALQALHQERRVLKALALGSGVGLLANAALIPVFGVLGAVYAQLVSAFLQLAILGAYVRRLPVTNGD